MRDEEVAVAGRVLSIRKLNTALIFYDLHGEGSKVLILLNSSDYKDKEDYETIAQLVMRGDIIGIKGAPGRTKSGELFISPTKSSSPSSGRSWDQ